jgi:hypothetical protein
MTRRVIDEVEHADTESLVRCRLDPCVRLLHLTQETIEKTQRRNHRVALKVISCQAVSGLRDRQVPIDRLERGVGMSNEAAPA